ncbi:MAG: ROK family transcriptional regulator [Microbacteriaceae bacterium]|nr:ROK family transcriptional regulator [Microbacteriaceae bacterium]
MPRPSWEHPGRGPEGPKPATPGLLRSLNDRVVLDLLLEHGALSRSDVWRLTGVSKPTASQSLTRLEESGHVLQSGVEESARGGRATTMYRLNPRAGFAAAIDVTATGVHVRIADLLGTVIGEHRGEGAPRPQDAIDALQTGLERAGLTGPDLSALVVALPGSYDPDADLLRFAPHLPRWLEPGLLARLEEAVGAPAYIENDVNLVAIAEQRVGAARDDQDFLLLWSDEGLGSAIVLGGRLHRGGAGGAGEIAYLLVPGIDVVRNPVREDHGGFDDLAGAAAILDLAARHGLPGDAPHDAVATAVSSGFTGFIDELAERYAYGLASAIALLDPPAVVLAGRTMDAGGTNLVDAIRRQLDEISIRSPRLVLGEVAREAVITGALLVGLERTRDGVFST